jgi:hypothetical protein
MGHADREEYDYRPTVDGRIANVDLLLDALRREHGGPRYDIASELLKDHKGTAGKYHRKPLERP